MNDVKRYDEQIRQEISGTIAALVKELKHCENVLLAEVAVHIQAELSIQQETVEDELADVTGYCASTRYDLPNEQYINDTD